MFTVTGAHIVAPHFPIGTFPRITLAQRRAEGALLLLAGALLLLAAGLAGAAAATGPFPLGLLWKLIM